MRTIKSPKATDSLMMIRVYMVLILTVFIAFFIRFSQLMLFKTANGEDLTALVHQLYNRDQVIPAKRGNIYDNAGEIIATDVKTYSIYAVLTDRYAGTPYVEDKLLTAKRLAQHIEMPENDILKLLSQTTVNQTSFGNAGVNLSYPVKEAIEKEGLPGIYFTEKISRDYPKGYFANNVIGMAKDTREDQSEETDSNVLRGVMGLELQYNAQLRGVDGIVNYDKDSYGYSVPGTQSVIEEVQNGNHIYTTLDSRLTDYLEELMTTVDAKYKPQGMTAIVVRPKNGDVVATSQRPTFNQKKQIFPENGWVNQIVERNFEPGSIMKVIGLAAAINEGIFSPMDTYMSGSKKIATITISDWNQKGWGQITYLEGLARSSNVAFVNLVSEMGYDKWKTYLDAFGFGQSTQSGFANEGAGLNAFNTEENKAITSFGQGISATGLQMVQAFTAIANEGQMHKLRFVDRIENSETGEITYLPVEKLNSPITATTAKAVLHYLESVVYDENGTGREFAINDDIRVAAKTGTAEIYDEVKKMYLGNGQFLYTVVAFLPSDNPEYIVYLTMDRPQSEKLGTGTVALSEVFVPFAKYAMSYINGTVSESIDKKTAVLPDATGANVDLAKSELSKLGFEDIMILGDGNNISKQMPLDNMTYDTGTKIILYTDGAVTMPNITNWSKIDVLKLATLIGVNVSFEGEGYVDFQSIADGEKISSGDELMVKLSARGIVSRKKALDKNDESASNVTNKTTESDTSSSQ